MNQAKEYTIVVANSPVALITEVTKKMKDGWQPIGGLAIITGPVQSTNIAGYVGTQTISHQAMIR